MKWSIRITTSLLILILTATIVAAQAKNNLSSSSSSPSAFESKEIKFNGVNVSLAGTLLVPKLEAGKRYQIDVVAKDNVDPIVVVHDPAGKQLGFDDDGGGFPNSKLIVEAKTSGTYKIFAGTIGGEGKYLLTVKQLGGTTRMASLPMALRPTIFSDKTLYSIEIPGFSPSTCT